MPYPLPLTRTEAYLAYKAGVIQQSDLKPSLAIPRNGIDAWLAYWTGLTTTYPVKNVGKNLFDKNTDVLNGNYYLPGNTASSRILVANSTTMARTLLVRLQVGQTYTIQKKASARFRFGFTATNNPAPNTDGVITSRLANADTSSSVTFTVPNGSPYFVCNFFSDDQAADAQNGYDTIVNSIQIEEGSTATAYEPYTGEPLILQEEEAYIAYLCGAINEYPEKCLRRVGAYLRYLISARWGRPDHPLNREELYLSLIKTQVIPSGDPSSDIKIDGTAKAAFQDVKMYGDTYQQTYTGKNLCGGTLAQIKNRNQGGTWNGNQYTQSGITWTVYENADGTIDRIEASGQATENGKTFYIKSFDRQQFEEQLGSEETYTLSGCPQGGDSGYYVRVASTPWKVMLTDRGSAATGTLVPADNYNNVFVVLCVDIPAGQVNNLVFRPQLEKGSIATSYEPYVGGTPSPNLDYPQQIQTVTGRQVVNVQGKNLFTNIPTGSNNGVDFTLNNDGTYDIDGRATAQANNAIFITDLSKLTDGSTYTLSATKALPSGVQVMFEVFNGSTWVRHALGDNGFLNNSRQSITGQLDLSGGNRLRLTLRVQNGTTVDLENFGVQLELGSTVTPYEPYSSNDYEINLGKNLISANWESGRYNNSTGAKEPYSDNVRIDSPISVQPNTTYICSRNGSGVAMNILEYRADGSFIRATTISSGNSFTTGADTYSITMFRGISGGTDGIQLELGSNITPYAPYFTPIELCKLGTYQDYIWKDGEEWKLHKATKKLTFDASEDELWIKSGQSTSSVFVGALTNLRTGGFLTTLDNGALSKMPNFRFSAEKADGVFRYNKNVSSTYMDYLFLEFDTAKISTIGAFTTWLENNPSTLYAPMATATDAEITNTALIGQLNALVSGGAENGTTYIKVNATDPNLPGLLVVEAPKYE